MKQQTESEEDILVGLHQVVVWLVGVERSQNVYVLPPLRFSSHPSRMIKLPWRGFERHQHALVVLLQRAEDGSARPCASWGTPAWARARTPCTSGEVRAGEHANEQPEVRLPDHGWLREARGGGRWKHLAPATEDHRVEPDLKYRCRVAIVSPVPLMEDGEEAWSSVPLF
jgi:hypothetical protein